MHTFWTISGEILMPLLKDIFSFQIWASILWGERLSRVHIVWWRCHSFIKKFRNGLTGAAASVCVSSKIVARHLKYQNFSRLLFIRLATSWRDNCQNDNGCDPKKCPLPPPGISSVTVTVKQHFLWEIKQNTLNSPVIISFSSDL